MQYKVGLGYSLYSYTVLIFHRRNLTVAQYNSNTHQARCAALPPLNVSRLAADFARRAFSVLLSGRLPAEI